MRSIYQTEEESNPRIVDPLRYKEIQDKMAELVLGLALDKEKEKYQDKQLEYFIWLNEDKTGKLKLNLRGKEKGPPKMFYNGFEYNDSVEIRRIEDINLRRSLEIGRYNWLLDYAINDLKETSKKTFNIQRIEKRELIKPQFNNNP